MHASGYRIRGVVAAGLVVALGCVVPTGTALAYDASDDDPTVTTQASGTVYVDPNAASGPDTYVTIDEAVTNVSDGGTVTLRGDVKINSMVTIEKDVTLDLGGHAVEGPTMFACFLVGENHTVTLDGGGTLQSIHDHVFIVHGTLAIASGTLNTPAGKEALFLPQDKGTVRVSGGTFSSPVLPEWCAEGYVPRTVTPGDASSGYTVGKAIPRPSATDRVYDGTEQFGCDAAEGLQLSGGGTNVGDYTTTVTPADGYAWEPEAGDAAASEQERSEAGAAPVSLAWHMAPKQLEASMAHADDQTYRGSPLTPVVVADGDATLAEGTDYRATYANNTNAGTATYAVTGTGNYAGDLTGTFAIASANIADATFSDVADQTYTGKAIEPGVEATFNGKKLAEGTDYELAYANNTKVGTATIMVRGMGNFQGERTLEFAIVRAKATSATSGTSGGSTDTSSATTSQGGASTLPRTADQGPIDNMLCALVSGAIALVAGAGTRSRRS